MFAGLLVCPGDTYFLNLRIGSRSWGMLWRKALYWMTLTESKYESYHPTEKEFCQNRISTTTRTHHASTLYSLCGSRSSARETWLSVESEKRERETSRSRRTRKQKWWEHHEIRGKICGNPLPTLFADLYLILPSCRTEKGRTFILDQICHDLSPIKWTEEHQDHADPDIF